MSESPATSTTPPPLTHSTAMAVSALLFTAQCFLEYHTHSPAHLFPAAIQARSRSDRLIHRRFTASLLRRLRAPLFSQAPGCSSCAKLKQIFASERLFSSLVSRGRMTSPWGTGKSAPGRVLSIKLHPFFLFVFF